MGQTVTKKITFMAPESSYMRHNFKTIPKQRRFDGSVIPYLFIEPTVVTKECERTERFTILFSHGNSFDLGLCQPFLEFLSNHLQCNVCCYDYTGYGQNEGNSSEDDCIRDLEDIYYLALDLGIKKSQKVLVLVPMSVELYVSLISHFII